MARTEECFIFVILSYLIRMYHFVNFDLIVVLLLFLEGLTLLNINIPLILRVYTLKNGKSLQHCNDNFPYEVYTRLVTFLVNTAPRTTSLNQVGVRKHRKQTSTSLR